MDGKKLKEKLHVTEIPFNIIAERLGITAQALNSCFKVKDLRTGTIERIAAALGLPVSFFYTDPDDTNSAHATGDNSVAIAGNNNITSTSADNAVLHERIRMLEKLLDEKERLITVLMKQ